MEHPACGAAATSNQGQQNTGHRVILAGAAGHRLGRAHDLQQALNRLDQLRFLVQLFQQRQPDPVFQPNPAENASETVQNTSYNQGERQNYQNRVHMDTFLPFDHGRRQVVSAGNMKPRLSSEGQTGVMRRFLRSLFTATAIAAGVQILAIGVLAARLPDVVGGPEVRETRRLRLPKAKTLRLTNSNGWVRIRADDIPDIELDADIRIYSRVADKTDVLASYAKSLIQITPDADSLNILTEPEGRAPYAADVSVDYTILVPLDTDIHVKGINGNIWISKGCGSVEVAGQNSDIEIADAGGPVSAKSTNGRVRVTNAPAGATIETINGNVYVHMLGGAFSATTINGSIVARLLDPHVEKCRLETQNGGITLVMHPECGATIDAQTMQGVVKCDMPVDGDPHPRRKRYLNATIGSGHTGVRMETLNGNIWVARNST